MTLAAQTPQVVYEGNGSTSTFAISRSNAPIYFRSSSHIRAVEIDAAGIETPVTLGVHYNISGGPSSGVLTRIGGPLPRGHTLAIWREQPVAQETSFTTGGDFRAADHESTYDRIYEILQEHAFHIRRALKMPEYIDEDGEITIPVGPGVIPVLDSDGLSTVNLDDLGIGDPHPSRLSTEDGRIVGFARTNGHGGGRWRAHWTADNRIVVMGDQSAFGYDVVGDNWGPIEIPWDAATNGAIQQLYAGSNYLLIQTDKDLGNLWSFGANGHGQLGHGDTASRTTPTKIAGLASVKVTNVWTEASVGNAEYFWFARESEGGLFSCGYSSSQHVQGYNNTANVLTPRRVRFSSGVALADVVEVACSSSFAPVWVRFADGTACRWGSGTSGAHGNNSTSALTWPTMLETAVGSGVNQTGVTGIAVTGYSAVAASIVLINGAAKVAGRRAWGIGDGTVSATNITTLQSLVGTVSTKTLTKVFAGGGDTPVIAALASDGSWWQCGYNGFGQHGDGTSTPAGTMISPTLPAGFSVAATNGRIAGGATFVMVYVEATIGGVRQIAAAGYNGYYASARRSSNVVAALEAFALVEGIRGDLSSWQSVGDHQVYGIEALNTLGELRYGGANDQGQSGTQPGNLHSVQTLQRVASPGTRMLRSFLWRGAYNPATTYYKNDVVRYGVSVWLYTSAASSAGNAPPTYPLATGNLYWELLAGGALGYAGTSTTSLALSAGEKSLTTQANLSYNTASRVRLAAAAAGSMDGAVTDYNVSTGAMTVLIDTVSGSGTFTSWSLSLIGASGAGVATPGGASPQAQYNAAGVIAGMPTLTHNSTVGIAEWVANATNQAYWQLAAGVGSERPLWRSMRTDLAWTNGPAGRTNYTDRVFAQGINISAPGVLVDPSVHGLWHSTENLFYSGTFASEVHPCSILPAGRNGVASLTVSGGTVTAVAAITTAGEYYQAGQHIRGPGNSVLAVSSVDVSGGITGLTVYRGGSGLTDGTLTGVALTPTEIRPITFFLPIHGGLASGVSFSVDRLNLNTYNGRQRFLVDVAETAQQISLFDSMSIAHNANNVTYLKQNNAAGSALINCGYLDNLNRWVVGDGNHSRGLYINAGGADTEYNAVIPINITTLAANKSVVYAQSNAVTGNVTALNFANMQATGHVISLLGNATVNGHAIEELQNRTGTGDVLIAFSAADASMNWSCGVDQSAGKFVVSKGYRRLGNGTEDRVRVDDTVFEVTRPLKLPSYTVAGLPSASTAGAGSLAYVSNASGGPTLACSDGTNWKVVAALGATVS